jgi:ABC-2 type transport system permease protein
MRSNLWPIIKREYLTRVKTKGFWISTALFPILSLAFVFLPRILAERTRSSPEPIRVVDSVGDFYPVLQFVMSGDPKTDTLVENHPIGGRGLEEIARQLNTDAEQGRIQGYFIVDEAAIRDNRLVYFARNPSSAVASEYIRGVMRDAMTRYRLLRLGISGPAVDAAVERADFDIRKATNDARKQASGITAFFMSFAFAMFIYFTLLMYGVYILRGVLEEKSNRIVEIIVSSVKPFDLMMGKILGIGAVGLSQIAIWTLFGLALAAPQVAAAFSIAGPLLPPISTATLVFFPVYFILGYFLFATVYAGIGSMFNSDEDAQQMVSVATMLLVIPMMFLLPVIKNPSGGLATGLSLFPFFSPILMYLRITIQQPPAWQIALSLAIMIGTILLMVWLVSKIYRVGILMYGKKPTIPEIVRWLRYT